MTATATSMAIRADRAALAKAVGAVAAIVPPKGTVPIHATMRVEADPRGVLRITGTDASSWVEVTVDQCEVESPGLAHLPGGQFAGIVADLAGIDPGGTTPEEKAAANAAMPVVLEEGEGSIILKAKPPKGAGARFRLGMFAEVNDWPPMPARPETPPTLTMMASDLAEALRLVSDAADDKKGRMLFDAVHFVRAPSGCLRVVASDRKWLSLIDFPGVSIPAWDAEEAAREKRRAGGAKAEEVGDAPGVALPVKMCGVVQRLCAGDTAEWSVWVGRDVVHFEGAGHRIACRPLAGTPPPFDQVIGQFEQGANGKTIHPVAFDRKAWERVVKSASLVIAKRPDKEAMTSRITFHLSGEPERIGHRVSVKDVDGGEADIGVDLAWSGPEHQTFFSCDVLPQALKTLPDGAASGHLHWVGRKVPKVNPDGTKTDTITGSPLVVDYKRSASMRHLLIVMPLGAE